MSFSAYEVSDLIEQGVSPSQIVAVLGEPFQVIKHTNYRLELRHPVFRSVSGYGGTRLDAILFMVSQCYEMVHHKERFVANLLRDNQSSHLESEFAESLIERYPYIPDLNRWPEEVGGASTMDLSTNSIPTSPREAGPSVPPPRQSSVETL